MQPQSSHPDRIQIDLGHDATVVVSALWGSQNIDFREQIFAQIPQSESYQSSISHCPHFGGFLRSKSPCGFDLEVSERVSFSVVQRVSTLDETSQLKRLGIHPSFLWTAKEASWKATRNFFQPRTISKMCIEFNALAGEFKLKQNEKMKNLIYFNALVLNEKASLQSSSPGSKVSVPIMGACWSMRIHDEMPECTLSVCFR